MSTRAMPTRHPGYQHMDNTLTSVTSVQRCYLPTYISFAGVRQTLQLFTHFLMKDGGLSAAASAVERSNITVNDVNTARVVQLLVDETRDSACLYIHYYVLIDLS